MLMLLLVAFPAIVRCQNTDLFNYDTTRSWDGGMDYGPKEWDQVECDDIEECVRTVFFYIHSLSRLYLPVSLTL